MSDIIPAQGRTASTIAAEIRAHNSQFIFCVFEIGRLLIEAKALVPTGEWMEYLKTELGYKQSTANNFMRIYKNYNVDGHLPESQTFGNLSPSQALELLALPNGEREAFMEENDVASMSVRQLKIAIRERDEARDAQEKTDSENRDLRQQLRSAQQEAASAKSSEDAWQKEIDELNTALNKATADADRAKKELQKAKENPTIPAAMQKKLQAEAAEQSAKETEKKLQAQIAAAEEQARQATQAKEDALRTVADLEQKMKDTKKAEVLADPDIVKMTLIFDDLKINFNKANGCLKKVTNRNPAQGAKLKAGFMALVEAMMKELI